MKSSQIIIFHWIYTMILMNVFFYFFIGNSIWAIVAWKISLFWLLFMLPMFVKFALEDIEDEYRDMWRQVQMNGYIR